MAVDLETAFRRILEHATPLGTERVPVHAAAGRVAATPLRCSRPVPHFRRAALDGYVVWRDDVAEASPRRPVRLRVTGAVRMGSPPGEGPGRGEAWAIPTGGALPQRGDRVVPVEHVRLDGDSLVLEAPPADRTHVIEAGEDIADGTLLVAPGEVIRPGALGALLACGTTEVEVYRRPRVLLLSTGDELVALPAGARPPQGSVPSGRIPNTNTPVLALELAAAGCAVQTGGVIPDDPAALAEALGEAAEGPADVVLSTGGVSVGAADRVPQTWLELGAREVVGRIDLKPGGPFFVGRLEARWVVGLPGTPGACLATYHLLVRPVLLRLAGHRHVVRPIRYARLRTDLRRPSHRTQALWAVTSGEPPEVEVLDGGAGLRGAVRANALVLLRAGTPPLRAGSRMPTLALDRPEDRADLVILPAIRSPLVIGVVGPSGSGKTALIEGVVQRLRADGIAVGAVKHAAHGFEVDRPGSDSDRMVRAGAAPVLLSGPEEQVLRVRRDAAGLPVERLLGAVAATAEALGQPLELLLVEGFRHPDRPWVRVGRETPAGPGDDGAGQPWRQVRALADLPSAQRAAVLDDLAAQIRSWLREGAPAGSG